MDGIAMSHPFLFSDLTSSNYEYKNCALLTIVIFSCSEEAPVNQKPEPLPQPTLQFQATSLTVTEPQEEGLTGTRKLVNIITSETPKSPAMYYVILNYKATKLDAVHLCRDFCLAPSIGNLMARRHNKQFWAIPLMSLAFWLQWSKWNLKKTTCRHPLR